MNLSFKDKLFIYMVVRLFLSSLGLIPQSEHQSMFSEIWWIMEWNPNRKLKSWIFHRIQEVTNSISFSMCWIWIKNFKLCSTKQHQIWFKIWCEWGISVATVFNANIKVINFPLFCFDFVWPSGKCLSIWFHWYDKQNTKRQQRDSVFICRWMTSSRENFIRNLDCGW